MDHDQLPRTNWDMLVQESQRLWAQYKVLVSVGVALMLVLLAVAAMKLGGSEQAPDFTLTDTDGLSFSLSDYRGDKIVVIDLMSTSCGPCEIFARDTLKPLYEEGYADLRILSISVGGTDTSAELRDYADEKGFAWRHAVDEDLKVTTSYQAQFIPKVVIIDVDGRATYEQLGGMSLGDIEEQISKARTGASAIKLKESSIFLFAIGAGALAFFSPCSFPLLPGYMSYYLNTKHKRTRGLGEQTARDALPAGLAAAAGILLVFGTIALVVVLISNAIAGYLTLLEPIVGIVIVTMGVVMVTGYSIDWLIAPFQRGWGQLVVFVTGYTRGRVAAVTERGIQRVTRSDFTFARANEEGHTGLFWYGVGYGSASSGCTAPVFIALLLASLEYTFLGTLVIFALYSFSAAVLMVVFTLLVAASEETLIEKLRVSTGRIKQIGGWVLIAVGLYLIWFYLRTEGYL